MKVYIVTSGCYSDYCIDAVFLDMDAAAKYCATHTGERLQYGAFNIEEYETQDDQITTKRKVYEKWRGHIRNGRIAMEFDLEPQYGFENRDYFKNDERYGVVEFMVCTPIGTKREKAWKIIIDRYNMWLYEKTVEKAEAKP